MSCQNNRNINNNVVYGPFIPLETDFIKSSQIYGIQNKTNNGIPQDTNGINNRITNLFNDKNENAALNGINKNTCQYTQPTPPITTNKRRFSSDKNPPKLLENFDLNNSIDYLWNDTNMISYRATGMSFIKFIMLIVLLCILAYGLYWFYSHDTSSK